MPGVRVHGRRAASGAVVVLAVVAVCLGGRAAPAAEAPPDGHSRSVVTRRIRSRTFPSVFQAWSRAEGIEGESRLQTMARHDLVFHGVGAFSLRWDKRPSGLATGLTPASIERGRATPIDKQSVAPRRHAPFLGVHPISLPLRFRLDPAAASE